MTDSSHDFHPNQSYDVGNIQNAVIGYRYRFAATTCSTVNTRLSSIAESGGLGSTFRGSKAGAKQVAGTGQLYQIKVSRSFASGTRLLAFLSKSFAILS